MKLPPSRPVFDEVLRHSDALSGRFFVKVRPFHAEVSYFVKEVAYFVEEVRNSEKEV